MAKRPKILLVDDDEDHLLTLKALLRQAGHPADTAGDAEGAVAALQRRRYPLVITDLRMPGMSGEELLEETHRQHPDTAVVVLTGYGSIESAVEAIKKGAVDYVTKPYDPEDLLHRVRRILRTKELEEENRRLREELARAAGKRQILGESPQVREVLSLIDRVALVESTVLIQGESGVGKELVAHAIHHKSHRKSGPFIKVSCAALPENLLEVELFGHEKGAYTDAYDRRIGRFEMADGGTLFLDEIGDVSPKVQVKLLRVLQEREFERVGGTETIQVDVRIISATNQDLLDPHRQVPFREDLYYRLNVIPIFVPPLRQREGDLVILAQAFVERIAQETNRSVKGIADQAMDLLQNYPWPGNVRELENAIERAVVLTDNEVLQPEDFLFLQVGPSSRSTELRSLEDAERDHIQRILEAVDGNRNRAARILGIHRETLYNKIKKYELEAE